MISQRFVVFSKSHRTIAYDRISSSKLHLLLVRGFVGRWSYRRQNLCGIFEFRSAALFPPGLVDEHQQDSKITNDEYWTIQYNNCVEAFALLCAPRHIMATMIALKTKEATRHI